MLHLVLSLPNDIAKAQLFTLAWMLPMVLAFYGIGLLPVRIRRGLYVALAGAVMWQCCAYIPPCDDWFFYIMNPICWW